MATEVEELGQTMHGNDESGMEQRMPRSFVFVHDDGVHDESIVVLDSLLDTNSALSSIPELQYRQTRTLENSHELHERLAKLAQENGHLKEILEQNKLDTNEHVTLLLKTQDELVKVYDADKQKFDAMQSLVDDLRTENNELKARLEANEKTADAEASTQTEESNDSITADNYPSTGMLIMAEKFQCQNQEIAHKIIMSLKDQLQSLYETTFKPISLEDLQSNMQFQEDPHGQQFRNSFAHYNEKLRQLGYCYAAHTARYTSIQNCLQQCSELLVQKQNPVVCEISCEASYESQIDRDLRVCRNMLIDEEFKLIAEREEMIKAQSDFQRIFVEFTSMLNDIDNLRTENERLIVALQSARSINDERVKNAEAAVMEKERLIEEQRMIIEQNRQSLLERNREFQRLSKVDANSLREQEILVEQQKREIEYERQMLSEQRTELERLVEVNTSRERFLAEERRNLEQAKADSLAQIAEFRRQKEIEGKPEGKKSLAAGLRRLICTRKTEVARDGPR